MKELSIAQKLRNHIQSPRIKKPGVGGNTGSDPFKGATLRGGSGTQVGIKINKQYEFVKIVWEDIQTQFVCFCNGCRIFQQFKLSKESPRKQQSQ